MLNSTKTWQDEYNMGTKELLELTTAIEYAINEGGLRGNVAKDNLSRQFNDKLKQFISDLRKKDMEELIMILNGAWSVELKIDDVVKLIKNYYTN